MSTWDIMKHKFSNEHNRSEMTTAAQCSRPDKIEP